jgi:Fic family protein
MMTKVKTRPAIILLSLFTLRYISDWLRVLRQLSHDDVDLETWLIVISVTAIGAEKFLRSGLQEDLHDLRVAMPTDRLAKCNLSSIAAATGLNRETVRRKVNWLLQAGILEREASGAIRASATVAARPEVQKLIAMQIEALRQVNAQLNAM